MMQVIQHEGGLKHLSRFRIRGRQSILLFGHRSLFWADPFSLRLQ